MGHSTILLLIITMSLSNLNLNVAFFNMNGFTSSEPYVRDLIGKYDIVCISEHWLSRPELYSVNGLCDNVASKCSNSLTDAP